MNPFEKTLRLIGYWSGGYGVRSEWPDAASFVDLDWDDDERTWIGVYLKHGLVARAWMGYARCRLCDVADNGSLDLTDGTYVWPEGLADYVLDHSVRLPEEFIQHVHAQSELDEHLQIDDTWWRGVDQPG